MAGRAGRAAFKDKSVCGESYLIASAAGPPAKLLGIVGAPLEPVRSCLSLHQRGLKRALLEAIALGLVLEPEEVALYGRCTLLAQQVSAEVGCAWDAFRHGGRPCLDFWIIQ